MRLLNPSIFVTNLVNMKHIRGVEAPFESSSAKSLSRAL